MSVDDMLSITEEQRVDIRQDRRKPVFLIGYHVDGEYLDTARDAIEDVLKIARVDSEIPIYTVEMENPFKIDELKMPNGHQIDAYKTITKMPADKYTAILTGEDINSSDGSYNFLIGLALPGIGTLISTKRFEGIDDIYTRNECIKTEVMHEIGHVFGAPNPSRKDLEDNIGNHCRNKCVMRQGVRVPIDWIKITRDRLETGKPYCDSCEEDLRKHFGIL